MKLEKFEVSVIGMTPLIMHSPSTANPLNPYSRKLKQMTSKRNKTEEDLEEILELQWEASLYFDDELGLYIPWENLAASFLNAAKKHKHGRKTCAITFSHHLGYSLNISNAKNLNKLREDKTNRFVKVVTIQRSKTLNCRAIFNKWDFSFGAEIDTSILNESDFKLILSTAQAQSGLGDWRPSSPKPGPYGKFMIKDIKKV